MKRILSLLIAAVIAISAFTFPNKASAVTHGFLSGDANDDGELSMKDVLLTRRYIAGLEEDRAIFFAAADIVNDEDVNAKDVLKMRRIIAGLEDEDENNSDKLYKVSEFKIGGRNVSRYTIVTPGAIDLAGVYTPTMDYSALYLQEMIRKACGVSLNVAPNYDAPETYFIDMRFDYDDKYELGAEGFVFDLQDNGNFVITCGNQRGALYAVYSFLEDFVGYRFLPADITYLYEASTRDVPSGYFDRRTPGFEYRGINQAGTTYRNDKDPEHYYDGFEKLRVNALDGGGFYKDWNGGGLGTLYIHAHSFAYQMLGFDLKYTDYANDFTNKYHTSQPCMTAEDTYEKIIDFNYRLIEERTEWGQRFGFHYTQISCSSNDNTNYCPCNKCKAVYESEKSVAGAVIRLANRVADTMGKDFPDLDIYTIAYAGGNVAPKLSRPLDNVCVCFCTTGCNNHSLRNTEECDAAGGNRRMVAPIEYGGELVNYANGKDMAYMQSWLELTDNIYFWYYCANYNYFMAPAANLFNFYDDIKYLAERGMIGIYAEGSSEPAHYNFEYLRTYLISKMLWDPFMTEEEYEGHMDEFLQIYYGAGWRYIKQYIFMSNYASDINGCWTNNHDSLFDVYNEEYFRDNYNEMAELFVTARDLAETNEQKFRIDSAAVSCNFLGLAATYDRDYANGDAESRAKYEERYEWLWHFYDDNAYKEKVNEFGIKGYVYGFETGKANLAGFPQTPGDVRNPLTWIFNDDFDGHAGFWEFPFGKKQ